MQSPPRKAGGFFATEASVHRGIHRGTEGVYTGDASISAVKTSFLRCGRNGGKSGI